MTSEELKLQLAVIAASGLILALAGALLIAVSEQLTPTAVRYLLPLPPIGVAAYVFVFSLLRDRGGEAPGLLESLTQLGQASLLCAGFFGMLAGGTLLLAALYARL